MMARLKSKSCFFLLPAAFVVGSLIGGWSAREEFRKYRRLQAEVQEKRQKAPASKIGLGGITSMLNIPEKAAHPKPWRRNEVVTGDADEVESDNPLRTAPDGDRKGFRRHFRGNEDLGARIDEAKELWDTRRTIAREQLVAKFGLDEARAAQADEVLGTMNRRLEECFALIGENLEGDRVFTPELGARIIGELGGIFADAYDGLGACVDPTQREAVGELVLRDFIDPTVAEPLVEVQDKLKAGPVGLEDDL